MRNLKHSNENPCSFLKKIGKSLKGSNLSVYNKIEDSLFNQYSEFDKNHISLEKVNPLWNSRNTINATDFDLARNLYSRQKTCISNFWEDMKNVNGGKKYKCPLCGIHDVTDIDHYMPRSVFPEYSVHPLNLIPICHECNKRKGDVWLTDKGERLIFNAYFDVLIKADILECKISIDDHNMPYADIVFNGGIRDTEQTRLVVSTITKMNYICLYNDEVNELLAKEILRIKERLCINGNREIVPNEVWNDMKKEYSHYIENRNAYNEAEILLFKGLVLSSDFEKWIETE